MWGGAGLILLEMTSISATHAKRTAALCCFLLLLLLPLQDGGNFGKVLSEDRLEDVIGMEITERVPLTPPSPLPQPSCTSIQGCLSS